MKKALLKFFSSIEPDKKKSPFLHTLYDGFFTFALTPDHVTKSGAHIRDGMDLKRTMVFVVLAMQLCYLFGMYNTGHQHFSALGQYVGLWDGWHLKLVHGLIKLLPIIVVAHVVGLGIEFYYAYKKGHGIEEGFLVSGALIPLIMPPDLPLSILALSVAFAVIIGKEAFGGTGMNILNIALLSRVFVFFAYPGHISGDDVWISGIDKVDGAYVGEIYGWGHHLFDSIFKGVGWETFGAGGAAVIDGYTGATPLALAAKGGWEAVTQVYNSSDMFWGLIPGSVGETNKPFIIFGALMLIATGIASCLGRHAVHGCALVLSLLYGEFPFCDGIYGYRPGDGILYQYRQMDLRFPDRRCRAYCAGTEPRLPGRLDAGYFVHECFCTVD